MRRSPEVLRLADQLCRENGAACNCGGPQYGTGHAPDCESVLSYDDCVQDADQIIYEREEERRTS